MIFGGIDAGGTKTRCLVVNEEGEILAEGRAGCGNIQTAGLKYASEEISKAYKQACFQAGIERVDLLGVGIAGAGSPDDLKEVRKVLLPLLMAEKVFLTDDGMIAVMGAHSGKPGLIVVCGTGSIVYGLRKDGYRVRGGGWGPLLGDEGSGFWIVLESLKAIIKGNEGRGPKTILTERLLKGLGIENLRALIPYIYRQNLPRKELASLAPLVIEAMVGGDKVATEIIERGFQELIDTAIAVSNRLDFNPERVAVTGGIFRHEIMLQRFKMMMQKRSKLDVIRPEYSSVWGAIIYACQKAGLEIEKIFNRR